MSTFVCGPWGGEFGWLVATWVPACRRQAQKHDRTIAICQPGHEDLFRDFATEIIAMPCKGKPDRWLCGGKKPKLPKDIAEAYPDAKVWRPKGDICYNKPRAYYKYGQYSERDGHEFDLKYDIVIHARNMSKYGQSELNWPRKHWIEFLARVKGSRIATIGHPDGAMALPGAIDFRGAKLGVVCNLLANSRVCVGTSSGPMHLASHCGCPHVVFTYDKLLKSLGGRNNRWRYEVGWNPFKTPVVVIDKYGWIPPVKAAVRGVEKLIGCA